MPARGRNSPERVAREKVASHKRRGGDPEDPIRFVYFADKELIHIAGKGKVLNQEGTVIFPTP